MLQEFGYYRGGVMGIVRPAVIMIQYELLWSFRPDRMHYQARPLISKKSALDDDGEGRPITYPA